MDYLPLARAAALVHARLFPDERVKDAKTLDLIALALSALIPFYQQEGEKDAPRVVPPADIAKGRFTRGATRLELPDREPLRFLLVSRAELYPAIERIAKDPTCPILRWCRRLPPAECSSAPGA
jgi:hypothetical protein